MKKMTVIRHKCKVKNNLTTPTMKMKRHILEKEKTPHYEKWYSDANTVIWEN